MSGVPACPVVLDDEAHVGRLAAELVANRLRAGPGLRLLLPTGRTPHGMYAALRSARELPTASAVVFQLDEYAGLGPDDPRSFAATLQAELAGLEFAGLHLLDGSAPDLERHQRELDAAPIGLAVLGLGRDGHVAFDEPGSRPEDGVKRVRLAAATLADADPGLPHEAITVGMRTLLQASAILLLVTGEAKAEPLRAMLEDPVSTRCPASLLRDHPRLKIICDRAAASRLRPRAAFTSDRALIVLGHRDPGTGSEHLASEASFARLHHAAVVSRRSAARFAVLTGWTTTGGLSEAEQMLTAWNEPDTPALAEVAGRNTAENASRTLPLLLAAGGIRRVTVVTSSWHLRAPFFFAPYARHGIAVERDPARHHGPWLPMLAHELHEAPGMWRERRAAMAEMERQWSA